MGQRRPDTLRVRRSSLDRPLPQGSQYFDWDAGFPRDRAERRFRREQVRAPDGRVGDAIEWEETVFYQCRPVVPQEGHGASTWDEARSLLRATLVVAGLFIAVAVCWDAVGGSVWPWIFAWLGLSWWLA